MLAGRILKCVSPCLITGRRLFWHQKTPPKLCSTYVYILWEESWSSCGCCLPRCVLWCLAQRSPPSQPISRTETKQRMSREEEERKVEETETGWGHGEAGRVVEANRERGRVAAGRGGGGEAGWKVNTIPVILKLHSTLAICTRKHLQLTFSWARRLLVKSLTNARQIPKQAPSAETTQHTPPLKSKCGARDERALLLHWYRQNRFSLLGNLLKDLNLHLSWFSFTLHSWEWSKPPGKWRFSSFQLPETSSDKEQNWFVPLVLWLLHIDQHLLTSQGDTAMFPPTSSQGWSGKTSGFPHRNSRNWHFC